MSFWVWLVIFVVLAACGGVIAWRSIRWMQGALEYWRGREHL